MFDLRRWLRRTPQPAKLRIKVESGEERLVELSKGRKNWATIEESVRASGAVSVECLKDNGEMIRGRRFNDDDMGYSPGGGESDERDSSYDDKVVSRALLAQAQMLDRYGARMNEAYDRGAAAASSQQEKLVELVSTLIENNTTALTNLNNMSVNYSNALAALGRGGDEGGDGQQLIAGILALLSGRPPPISPTPPNGAKKP